jgi:hypothetical protein
MLPENNRTVARIAELGRYTYYLVLSDARAVKPFNVGGKSM